MGGALLLHGEDRKIHILTPAICKWRTPHIVLISTKVFILENFQTQMKRDEVKIQNILIYAAYNNLEQPNDR